MSLKQIMFSLSISFGGRIRLSDVWGFGDSANWSSSEIIMLRAPPPQEMAERFSLQLDTIFLWKYFWAIEYTFKLAFKTRLTYQMPEHFLRKQILTASFFMTARNDRTLAWPNVTFHSVRDKWKSSDNNKILTDFFQCTILSFLHPLKTKLESEVAHVSKIRHIIL